MRMSVCVGALLLVGCDAEASTYDEAAIAYSQNRVGEAEAALRKVAADPASSAEDKARAWRELGRIAWRIDGSAAAALEHLAKAEATGEDACPNARLRARILQESGLSAQLVAGAPALAGHCEDPFEAGLIRLDAAEAALDLASRETNARPDALARARTLVAEMHPDVAASLEGSALRLQLGLLARDAPGAITAWKDYFWLTDSDVPQAMRAAFPQASSIFEGALGEAASPQSRLQLVDMLVRAGFADAAERFAASAGLPENAAADLLWRKASAYFAARRELEATLLASNRRVARGGRASDLAAAARKAAGTLLAAAGLEGDPAVGLRQAYGLYGTVGETEGYASVHYGHVVQAERREIEQYGRRASVAFVAIDNMIANGFNSWLWDGRAAAGGWTAAGPVIVQVRPQYTSGPLAAWSLFSGGPYRQRLLDRQAARAKSDVAALSGSEVAYLPGLADRLRIQAAAQIGERAKAIAGKADDLRTAFLEEYWRASLQQSIFTHEGRHALDQSVPKGHARLDHPHLEYRAKLSELALSDYPRLALFEINDSSIGGGNAHGKANARVLKAYVDWIRRNSGSVAGYDPALPPMAQIDKLTDDQIRTIARSLDPFAK